MMCIAQGKEPQGSTRWLRVNAKEKTLGDML
jgi:hypothetical protein